MIKGLSSRGYHSLTNLSKKFNVSINKLRQIIKMKKIPVVKTSNFTFVSNRHVRKLYYFVRKFQKFRL